MGNTSTKDTTSSGTANTQSNPWAPTQGQLTGTALPALQTAFGQSQQGNNATKPTDFLAGLTPEQIQNFQQMIQAGGNTGGATSILNGGSPLFSTGAQGATSALGSLLGFNANNLNPGAISGDANQFVAGANIPAQVRAAMQSGMETARDVINPGIDANAAGTGNTNNSRTGLAQGLVDRGLAEQAGNLSGALSGQTYTSGLNTASNNAQNQNSSILAALSAALGGGSNLIGQGAGAVSSGIDSLISQLGLGATGGAGLQQGNQTSLSNQLAQNQYATQNPFASLSQYLPFLTGIAGLGGQTSSQTTNQSTEKSTPSALATIGSLIGAGGSLLGGSGPMGSTGLGGVSGVSSLLNNLLQRKS